MEPNIGVRKEFFACLCGWIPEVFLGEVMRMKVRALLSSVVVLATMSLVGCGHYTCGTTFGNATCTSSGGGISQGGGGGGTIGVRTMVYFNDVTLSGSEMAAEGLNIENSQTFAPVSSFVSPSLPAAGDTGIAIVSEHFLYMPFTNSTIYGFSIDATTGALTPVTGSPYSITFSPSCVAVDPSGAFLFVGGSSGISVFSVSATDGSLLLTGSTPTSGSPQQMTTDGQGKFLYALEGSGIAAFSYGVSGTLTAVQGSPFNPFNGVSMAQIEGESSGKYLVGTTAEAGGGSGIVDRSLYVFAISATGALTAAAGSPVTTVYPPVYVAVSPNGSFVYTFNEETDLTTNLTVVDPMEGYGLSSAGALTPISGSPFTQETATIGKFDQSGLYIFAEGGIPNTSIGGTFAYGASTTTGALTSTLPHAGAPPGSFAVTDLP